MGILLTSEKLFLDLTVFTIYCIIHTYTYIDTSFYNRFFDCDDYRNVSIRLNYNEILVPIIIYAEDTISGG